jgi:hypothetical protein
MMNGLMTFKYPENKEDCSEIECSVCGLMAEYLLKNKCFECFEKSKSKNYWRN